jgi:hypothetical protein
MTDMNLIEETLKEELKSQGVVHDPKCKKCNGRGFVGVDAKTKEPALCPMLKKQFIVHKVEEGIRKSKEEYENSFIKEGPFRGYRLIKQNEFR